MKSIKLLSVFVFVATFSFNSNAQVNPHAIGVRLGGSHYGYYGGEISYQHGFGDKNRLEIDLGARNHKNWGYIGVSVLYHWVWNLTDGLNWYIGPGARIGNFRHRYDSNARGIALGIGGQIGLEYDFNAHGAPILLSLDARPMYEIWNYVDYDHFGYGTALGIRYTF